jgi:NAD(P)-dependent dehydrogenase (short-subunit alcohol dehydrogenase family)
MIAMKGMRNDYSSSMTQHSGRVALVTGGSRGIGAAIAKALVEAGASVASTSRSGGVASSAKLRQITADVRNPGEASRAVEETVAEFDGLDILVNNAGVGLFANVTDMSPEQWHDVIDTNLSGVFYCCHAAIPHLRKRGGGWIINISSLASKNAFAGGAAYCASKAAINQFSEALMQEVRHDNIRVSCVLPGSVETGFGRGMISKEGWALRPEDVAQVVMDLIAMPARSLPSRVELRPSRPPKK